MAMNVHPKVKASSAGAAVSGLVIWALGRFLLHGSVDPVVAAEICVVIPAALAGMAGYLAPSRRPPDPQPTAPPAMP